MSFFTVMGSRDQRGTIRDSDLRDVQNVRLLQSRACQTEPVKDSGDRYTRSMPVYIRVNMAQRAETVWSQAKCQRETTARVMEDLWNLGTESQSDGSTEDTVITWRTGRGSPRKRPAGTEPTKLLWMDLLACGISGVLTVVWYVYVDRDDRVVFV